MDVHKRYVIYEFNMVMGSAKHLALQKVELKGYDNNDFETEDLAIQYLIDKKMTMETYLIIRNVYIN